MTKMNKEGDKLENGIRELARINSKYPLVNEILNELIGDEKDSFFVDLLSQARVVGKIDRFIGSNENNGNKFCELADKYSQFVYMVVKILRHYYNQYSLKIL